METKIRIAQLANGGDMRGLSFTAPSEARVLLGRVHDLDLSSTEPGAVRNEDNNTLWLIALSSESYDPAESVTRKVV
jgi:hypothetical protein